MKKILNISLGVLLVITVLLLLYAVVAGINSTAAKPTDDPALMAAISANLIWGYILFALAIVAALGCAVYGMAKNPAGIKGTLLSLLLVIVVIGVAYFIAAGHTIQIPDLANNDFFGHNETVLTEASIIVTYVAMAAAFLTAIVTEIWRAFK